MRVYFKGAVLALGAFVVVVLMMVHHYSGRHELSVGDSWHNGARREQDGDRATHRRRPVRGGRQGAATSAATIHTSGVSSKKASKASKASKARKGSKNNNLQETAEDTSPQVEESKRPATEDEPSHQPPDKPQDSPSATNDRVALETAREDTSQEAPSTQAAVVAARAPEPQSRADQTARDGASRDNSSAEATATIRTIRAGSSLKEGSQGVRANVSIDAALNLEKVDIRTVDPLSATEPMVMRQQEELEEQRFGFQPWRGRPKPPKKLQDLSKSWLTDNEYPDWYLESVIRSRVYGKEGEFVGGGALFEGPCEGADEAKAQFQADEVQTFSYVEPGQLIPGSKNPCWYEDPARRKQLRCLPYFFVAGVAKCGTTDLYKRVRYHPDIMEGELKEYHWWDRLRYGAPMELKFTKESEKNDRPLPLALYSRLIMGDEVEDLKSELRSKNRSEKICGDGSPSYLWDPKEWPVFEGNEGCTEPRYVIGSFIQHATPRARIILLLRQPTQRLYSRFLSRRDSYPPFKGATSRTFHDYVVNGVAMYKACFREHSIRECAYSRTLYDEAVIRIVEGMYSVFVEDWLRIFKRDQILVIRNEDYSEDIEGRIIEVFNFLGVAKLAQSKMRPVLTHVSTNIGQNYRKVGAMLPETIAILNEFYKPFVLRLHELIRRDPHDDRFLWKDIAVT